MTITIAQARILNESSDSELSRLPIRDSDGYVKYFLKSFFQAFIKFTIPKLYRRIDWSRPWEFISEEMFPGKRIQAALQDHQNAGLE